MPPVGRFRRRVGCQLRSCARGGVGRAAYSGLVPEFPYSRLRRWPDVEADNLQAHDATDLLLVERALALDEGLVTPVVRGADRLGLVELATQIRELAGRARAGKLDPPEYQGNTFTVSNLGMFGIEHFTAVINTPEAAILAVGAAMKEPTVLNGEVVIRDRMRVTLSVDHRALDGADGARYLQALKQLLETPMRLLVS